MTPFLKTWTNLTKSWINAWTAFIHARSLFINEWKAFKNAWNVSRHAWAAFILAWSAFIQVGSSFLPPPNFYVSESSKEIVKCLCLMLAYTALLDWDNLWERRGGSMVNGVPRRFPRVLYVLPREKIEGPPRDFLKANLRPHPRPDHRPKTRGAVGFALRKSQRVPSIFFWGNIEYSRDLP